MFVLNLNAVLDNGNVFLWRYVLNRVSVPEYKNQTGFQ